VDLRDKKNIGRSHRVTFGARRAECMAISLQQLFRKWLKNPELSVRFAST
jgi:hypothetical protein